MLTNEDVIQKEVGSYKKIIQNRFKGYGNINQNTTQTLS